MTQRRSHWRPKVLPMGQRAALATAEMLKPVVAKIEISGAVRRGVATTDKLLQFVAVPLIDSEGRAWTKPLIDTLVLEGCEILRQAPWEIAVRTKKRVELQFVFAAEQAFGAVQLVMTGPDDLVLYMDDHWRRRGLAFDPDVMALVKINFPDYVEETPDENMAFLAGGLYPLAPEERANWRYEFFEPDYNVPIRA